MLRIRNKQDWEIEVPSRSARRDRASGERAPGAEVGGIPAEFLPSGSRVEYGGAVQPRRLGDPSVATLDLAVSAAADEVPLVLVRHPSGAITFHASDSVLRPVGRGQRRGEYPFRIEFAPQSATRRGWLTTALRLFVCFLPKDLVDRAIEMGLAAAASAVEQSWWSGHSSRPGELYRLNNPGQGIQLLPAARPDAHQPALLFLHGTFSSVQASFGKLLTPRFLETLSSRYPGGVFGWEHYSFSQAPERNVADLRKALATCTATFDVVGYSRGGLLARLLAQDPGRGADASWRMGRVVLCATPNQGTPLATSGRWEQALNFLTNLLELFPDNPLVSAPALVGQGMIWLAARFVEAAPGVAAMSADGQFLGSLNRGTIDRSSFNAIAANFHPQGNVWARLLDAGIDGFFAGANDLVVPTAGALQPGRPGAWLAADRIACFGPGGNLRSGSGVIHHLNIMEQPETAQFIECALGGQVSGLPPITLARPLAVNQHWRGGRGLEDAIGGDEVGPPRPATDPNALEPPASGVVPAAGRLIPVAEPDWGSREGDRTLHLIILDESTAGTIREDARSARPAAAMILASYGGARVVHRLPLNSEGDRAAGPRFQRIITRLEQIHDRLNGKREKMPSAERLRELGEDLFQAIFVGPILRLYDVARAEQGNRPLNLVITSAIPWLAAKPWEFAYDPSRRKFLATEDVHIVRNVLTAVPAERPPRESRPLRMLIVEAQPAGTSLLSIDEERERIRHRFQSLIDAGLAEVSVLVAARPDSLHDRILRNCLQGRPYDIVHFIGHGEFDETTHEGRLLFVEEEGQVPLPVGIQTLRELLCNRGIQLVFLNACDTARQPRPRDRGIAQALVEGGLPAVVANQFPVLDPSAVSFAERFYWTLAHGASLGAAAREARIAVNYSRSGEAIDWAVPVLHARDADYALCDRRSEFKPMSPGLQPEFVHRRLVASRQRPANVGVADLSRYFPSLPGVLERLNQAQDYFDFRETPLATPLEVWRRMPDRVSRQSKTYLIARELAAVLQAELARWGLDYLLCLTNWWLCESPGGDQNLFGWWSEDPQCRVLIGSTAGLNLPSRSPLAGRVLANEFVACCGGHLHDAHRHRPAGIIHEGPPANSVFRYHSERGAEAIVEPLIIAPRQERALLESIPRQLNPAAIVESFRRILQVF